MEPTTDTEMKFEVIAIYIESMRDLLEKHRALPIQWTERRGLMFHDVVVTGSPEALATFKKAYDTLEADWASMEAW